MKDLDIPCMTKFSNPRREMHRVSLTWCDFPLCRMGYRVLSTDPLEFLHCNEVSGYIGTILRSPGHIQRRRRFVLRLDLPFSWYSHATPPSLSFTIDQDFIPLLMQILQLKVPGKSRGTLERERRTGRAHKNVRVVVGIVTSNVLARFWNSVGAACMHFR